jgi:hypothetical protein
MFIPKIRLIAIKNRRVLFLTTGENVSSKSMPGTCPHPTATRRAFSFSIKPSGSVL